jgi:hypothetical protein
MISGRLCLLVLISHVVTAQTTFEQSQQHCSSGSSCTAKHTINVAAPQNRSLALDKDDQVHIFLKETTVETISDVTDIRKLSKMFSRIRVSIDASKCRVVTFEASECASASADAAEFLRGGVVNSLKNLLVPKWRHDVIYMSLSPYSPQCAVVVTSAKCTLEVSSRISSSFHCRSLHPFSNFVDDTAVRRFPVLTIVLLM